MSSARRNSNTSDNSLDGNCSGHIRSRNTATASGDNQGEGSSFVGSVRNRLGNLMSSLSPSATRATNLNSRIRSDCIDRTPRTGTDEGVQDKDNGTPQTSNLSEKPSGQAKTSGSAARILEEQLSLIICYGSGRRFK